MLLLCQGGDLVPDAKDADTHSPHPSTPSTHSPSVYIPIFYFIYTHMCVCVRVCVERERLIRPSVSEYHLTLQPAIIYSIITIYHIYLYICPYPLSTECVFLESLGSSHQQPGHGMQKCGQDPLSFPGCLRKQVLV